MKRAEHISAAVFGHRALNAIIIGSQNVNLGVVNAPDVCFDSMCPVEAETEGAKNHSAIGRRDGDPVQSITRRLAESRTVSNAGIKMADILRRRNRHAKKNACSSR